MAKKITIKLIELTYFLSICLPIYSANKIGSYIKIFGNFNVIHLLLLVSLFLIVLNKTIAGISKITKFDGLVLLYIVFSFIMAGVGILSKYDNVFVELVWYVVPALFYFLIKYLSENGLSILDFMDLTYIAMFGNCIFNLVMYLTKDSSLWGYRSFLGTKYGGNYYTVLCLTFSYGIHLLYNKERRIQPILVILNSALTIWCLIVAQSRSLMILALIPGLVVLFLSFKDHNSKRGKMAKFVLIIVAIGLSIIGVQQLMSSDLAMANRLAVMSLFSEEDTFMVRVYSFWYNLKLLFSNILGRGLGYPLYFYGKSGIKLNEVIFLDNTFITEAVRGGFIILVILLYAILKPLRSLKKKFRYTGDTIYLTIFVAYAVFVLNSTMMTAQSIHGFAVSVAMWSFISVCVNENKNDRIQGE